MKLKHEAFIELSRHLTDFFYKHFNAKTWLGHRLAALDGSTVRLPHIEEIAHHFGVWKVRQGDPCPMARVSQMFDPLNRLSLDAIISPKKTGERELATKHCQNLLSDDLLLLDRGYPHDIFMELYHQRWPVEEDYKTMKCWLELENFSGKSVLSIYQDFHAKVFSKNLTSALAFPTQEEIKQNNAQRKYDYQVNFTQALSKTKDVFVLLFQKTKKSVIQLISELHDIFVQTVEPIRPGRKYPRNHKVSRRKYFSCYKSFA